MFFCFPIFIRYWEELSQWRSKNSHGSSSEQGCPKGCDCKRCRERRISAYKFAWLIYIGTVTKCAPQLCLQVYIMLRQWHFPYFKYSFTGFHCLEYHITRNSTTEEKQTTKLQALFFTSVPYLAISCVGFPIALMPSDFTCLFSQ